MVFLDLQISIERPSGLLKFETYQKPMNLHMYIPPKSVHPPGLLNGLIYGRLLTYWDQNTQVSNFEKMTFLLFKRLLARGYSKDHLLPRFTDTIYRLQARANDKTTTKTHTDTKGALTENNSTSIFYHLPYHPKGITRHHVRNHYDRTLGPLLPNRQLTVAMSRPKNLADGLCRTRLQPLLHNNPSDYLCGDP